MTSFGDPAVVAAHPALIVGLVHPLEPWRADAACSAERTADDVEDIDALPVEEQAAIYCSIRAASHAYSYEAAAVTGTNAMYIGVDTWASIPIGGVDAWAEAEARIRSGEVRP